MVIAGISSYKLGLLPFLCDSRNCPDDSESVITHTFSNGLSPAVFSALNIATSLAVQTELLVS